MEQFDFIAAKLMDWLKLIIMERLNWIYILSAILINMGIDQWLTPRLLQKRLHGAGGIAPKILSIPRAYRAAIVNLIYMVVFLILSIDPDCGVRCIHDLMISFFCIPLVYQYIFKRLIPKSLRINENE